MGLRGKLEGKALKGKINKLVELRGYSAYEVAVLNGFEGSEEEWLSSLEGKPGKDGTDGEPGANGITPHIGNNGNWFIGETDTGMPSQGADGQDGQDGYTPVKVTVTQQSDGTYTAEDWTAAKILDAHNTGHTVYCQWGNRVLSLLVASKPFCAFGCVHSENVYTVTITAATVTVTTTPLASGSGANGITPHIGANGNWWIGDEDTGVKAAGGGGTSGIHIGSEPPTDENAVLWLNPEGEPADFVPTPSTASIGQTIRVKEVDENGKPTAWEAADFQAGGGGVSTYQYEVTTTEEVSAIEFDINSYDNSEFFIFVKLPTAVEFKFKLLFPAVEGSSAYDSQYNLYEITNGVSPSILNYYIKTYVKNAKSRMRRHLYMFVNGKMLTVSNPLYTPEKHSKKITIQTKDSSQTFPIGTVVQINEVNY